MCKVIAEIGLNHGGKISVAKVLIKQAKDSGCWGVKFQYRNIQTFYKKKDEVSDTIIYDEIVKNFLSLEEVTGLANYCRRLDIKFGISVFRSDDLNDLVKILNVIDFFKVPSAECLNIKLLEDLRKTNKKLFVSTGGHKTFEIIQKLEKYKNDITLFHCISNYPTWAGTQDLSVIARYVKSGFSEVGYSSHDNDWEVCLLALGQGAQWIERHITSKKDSNGLDHSSSSVASEFKRLVKFCNQYKEIIGSPEHIPNQGERINLQNLGTSLYAKRDISSGEKTDLNDYKVRAPRVGLSPGEFVQNFSDRQLLKPLKNGKPLSKLNFKTEQREIPKSLKKFARKSSIGLPVRLHDFSKIRTQFDVGTYEFHLSFSEVLTNNLNSVIEQISIDDRISIHLPDYIPGNDLLDPISRDSNIKDLSREVIQKVSDFSVAIENKIGKEVNIVGSFSKIHNKDRISNLNEIFEYLSALNRNILPQWLPVYAWYFGGIVKLEIFNSSLDINFIKENNLSICLDVSHLVMAASYYKQDWKDWYNELVPFSRHIHIADALDSKSEGLMFGDGIIGDFSEIIALKKLKIVECWQGHINEGEGFKDSLQTLYDQFNASRN